MKVSIIRRQDLRRLKVRDIPDTQICFLCNDYEGISFVKKAGHLSAQVDLLEADFTATFSDIRREFLSAWGKLNARYSSFVWWSGQVASKSVSANVFAETVVHYFRAKKLIRKKQGAIIFVVDSPALAEMVAAVARSAGRPVKNRLYRKRLAVIRFFIFWIRFAVKFVVVVLGIAKRSLAARQAPFLEQDMKLFSGRIVLLRTWVTESSFDKTGRFIERNFGGLSEHLIKEGYYVLTLPMFFNLKRPVRGIYRLLVSGGRHVIVPEKYLKIGDYLQVIQDALRLNLTRVSGFMVEGEDLSPLVNEVLERSGFDISLIELNMASYLLPRLKRRGIELSLAIYPFEGNAPEHPFILALRSSFPKAKVIGYQHTVLYPDQLAHYFADEEKSVRPLPDRIVCSGPAYPRLLAENGFPRGILLDGPNMRFTQGSVPVINRPQKAEILLPLTFSYTLAFDIFLKVHAALGNRNNFKIFVRTHPLLETRRLKVFLNNIGAEWELADEGTVQDWFCRVKTVITAGGSVTTLEAVVAGVPVIRVAPSLTFHYDCLNSLDYPVPVAYNVEDIRNRLELIEHLLFSDPRVFTKRSGETLEAYFLPERRPQYQGFSKGV